MTDKTIMKLKTFQANDLDTLLETNRALKAIMNADPIQRHLQQRSGRQWFSTWN